MKRVLKQGNKIKIIVSIMILVSIAGLIVIYPVFRKRDGTRVVAGYERDYIYYDRKLTVDDFQQFGYETTYQEVVDAVGEENGELAYNSFYPYYELSDGTYAVVNFFMGNKVHGIYIADKKEILYHLLPHVVPYKKDEEKEKELSYARQYETNIVLELFEIKEWQKPQASGEADDPMWGYSQEELEMYTNENWHIEIEYWFDDYENSSSESLYQSIKVYQNDELCGSALIIWSNCLVLECELLPVNQTLSTAWSEEEKMPQ